MLCFQIKRNHKESLKLFLSNLAKVRGRGQVEVADRWKDEVKACPAHKSGGKKVKKKSQVGREKKNQM